MSSAAAFSRLYYRLSVGLTGAEPSSADVLPDSQSVDTAFATTMRTSMCYFLVFAGLYFTINTLFYRVPGDPGLIPGLSLATLVLCVVFWAYNRQRASIVRLEITGHVVGLVFIGNALLDIVMQYQSIKLMYLVLLVPAFAVSGVRPRVIYITSLASIAGMLAATYWFDRAQLINCGWVAFTSLVVAVGISRVTRSAMLRAVKLKIDSDQNRDQAILLAANDALTGLPNRRACLKALDEHLAEDNSFYLGLVDLDGFKPINDIYGHSFGDQILVEVSRRLKASCGQPATVARLGGDEFAVIIPGLDEPALRALGDAMCAALAEPYMLNNETAYLSASIGFTERVRGESNTSKLLERSDYALYEAKERSRGIAVLFDRGHEELIRSTKAVEQALRGIDRDRELTLAFQPQYDLQDNRILGFEALARWHSETLGQVAPDVFIRAAERSGLITSLTPTLLAKALEAAASWPDDLRISFNLSARDLLSPRSVARILEVVRESGVRPQRIELEITETAMLTDFAQALKATSRLSETGCRIALDDFGSGYTNFGYLNQIKVHTVKIDRSFVLALKQGDHAKKIIKSMIELAGNLGMEHVVEGVETAHELKVMRSVGARMIQGFLFGKPMPADDIAAYLSNHDSDRFRLRPSKLLG
jgi:diguanylate cyclase (GGDEF)-like protein